MNSPEYWIDYLKLQSHPEGGYYSEIYRSPDTLLPAGLPSRFNTSRCAATSIYFLLKGTQKSKFHRLKSDEIWYYHCGSSAKVHILNSTGQYSYCLLGLDAGNNQQPQVLIPHDHWFAVEVLEDDGFILVGCAVFPGFEFKDFELADRAELTKKYPKYGELIRQFT